MSERRLVFERAWNVRDLGGYRGVEGRPVRWRRLYRADSLARLGDADLDRLTDLRLRTVIDLRTAAEVAESGRVRLDGDVAFHHLSLLRAEWNAASYDPARGTAAYLADRYLDMVEHAADDFGRVLSLVVDPDNHPLAFHCAGGKDRTGIVAALVLALLGVEPADITADYALTEEIRTPFETWFRSALPDRWAKYDALPPPFKEAPALAMAGFLERLDARYGSVEAYAKSVGVQADQIERLRAHLLG